MSASTASIESGNTNYTEVQDKKLENDLDKFNEDFNKLSASVSDPQALQVVETDAKIEETIANAENDELDEVKTTAERVDEPPSVTDTPTNSDETEVKQAELETGVENDSGSEVSLSAYGDEAEIDVSANTEREAEENLAAETVEEPHNGDRPASVIEEPSNVPEKEPEESTLMHTTEHGNVQDLPPPLPSRKPSDVLKDTPQPIHAVPPPLEEELKSDVFRSSIAALNVKSGPPPPPPVPPRSSHKRSVSADFDLVLSRFQENEDDYMSKDDTTQENLQEGARVLKSSYTAFLETVEPSQGLSPQKDDSDEDNDELTTVDWPFWTRLVSNYAEVAKKDSFKLEQEIAGGIPPQVRGIIWQLLSSSKSKEIDVEYANLQSLESPHEKAIERDLSRTAFIPQEKAGSLFGVLKAYSLHDPEVGYTQGMAFVATALLLNVESESEAFGLLISLMVGYGLRELYLPNMPGLHLKLYQFDRLIEENSPSLYNHLARQGVRSSMYASQWFLTCFAYRFPLCFVLRILDVVFVEGLEAILKFASVLMLKNEKVLMTLQFEQLLEFLKNGLFEYYLKTPDGSKSGSGIYKISSQEERAVLTEQDYAVNAFVKDAMHEISITPISLRRYIAEYKEIHLLESQKEAQLDTLRIKNKQLHNEVRKLERDHTVLNREHINIANELIENRLHLETLQDQNQDLQSEVKQLKVQLREEIRKQTLPNPDSQIPTDLRADLKETMARNLEVMNANQELQERIVELEHQLTNARHGKSKTGTAANTGNWKTLRKVWK
ncbi:LAFA_0G22100g1_1 [Lachancea sp. 'fantastica']|nr:LAFA_0G22100g1_1 [Lachancea sp. 'fantastica']